MRFARGIGPARLLDQICQSRNPRFETLNELADHIGERAFIGHFLEFIEPRRIEDRHDGQRGRCRAVDKLEGRGAQRCRRSIFARNAVGSNGLEM